VGYLVEIPGCYLLLENVECLLLWQVEGSADQIIPGQVYVSFNPVLGPDFPPGA